MSSILFIETSTNICSVAASHDGEIIFNQEDRSGARHNELLGRFVDEALSFTDNHAIPLDYVAVSSGPGSYTGLRVGVSMAKGVCYARDLKLVSVPTLELLCVPVLLRELVTEDESLLCPMLDARRMEVYSQIFDRSLREVRQLQPDVVESHTYAAYNDRPLYFFGNGSQKCKAILQGENVHFIDEIEPLAKNMLPLAEKKIAREEFEDVAYFVPCYLKDFVAKTPRKLL